MYIYRYIPHQVRGRSYSLQRTRPPEGIQTGGVGRTIPGRGSREGTRSHTVTPGGLPIDTTADPPYFSLYCPFGVHVHSTPVS
jgi:hypothetical protein